MKPEGLLVTSTSDANLIGAAVDLDDHEMPSGTSAAYALLAQLGNADPHYAEAATKILARMADQIAAAPVNWASLTAYAALHGPSAGTNSKGVLDSAALRRCVERSKRRRFRYSGHEQESALGSEAGVFRCR